MKQKSPVLGVILIAVGLSLLGYNFGHLIKPVIAAVLLFLGASMIFEWIMSRR